MSGLAATVGRVCGDVTPFAPTLMEMLDTEPMDNWGTLALARAAGAAILASSVRSNRIHNGISKGFTKGST